MYKEKFLALESLRGIAAISVALFHFNLGSHLHNAFVNNAWIMVDFFFVLSGFVIALNYLGRITTTQQLFLFQKKRFFRLYPLHIIMLFAFVAVEFARFFVELKFQIVANNPAFSTNNMTSFATNIFLIQNWVSEDLTFNGPSWSISAEFYTYAIFGILLVLTNGKKQILIFILIIAILAIGIFFKVNSMTSGFLSGPLRCLYSFSLGVLGFCLFEQLRYRILFSSSIPSMLCLILSVYVVTSISSTESPFIPLIPILFGITILILVLTKKDQKIHKVLSKEWAVYLGTISYGIYMIHSLIWWIIGNVLRFVFNIPSEIDAEGTTSLAINNMFIADVIMVFGLGIIIVLAHLSYKYVETRFN